MLDDLDDHHNAAVADHVLRLHRYQPVGMEGRPSAQVARRSRVVLGDSTSHDDEAQARKTSKVGGRVRQAEGRRAGGLGGAGRRAGGSTKTHQQRQRRRRQ